MSTLVENLSNVFCRKFLSLLAFVVMLSLPNTNLASEQIPTYKKWPKGTQAGSKGMVHNISPKRYQFVRVKAPHPVRYGIMSERFEIRDGECSGTDCSAPRQRSEIRVGNSLRRQNPKLNKDVWIGWSFFNASASSSPALGAVFGQWKVNRDQHGGYPILFFKAQRKPQDLRSRRGNDDVFAQLADMWAKGGYDTNATSWGNVCSLFNLDQVRGRWIDLVINTNFGTTSNGYLRIWVNGDLKCDYRGQMVASKKIDFGGADHRRGIYWSNTGHFDKHVGGKKPTMVVYYDEFRVGRTRGQVDIRMIEAAGGPPVD